MPNYKGYRGKWCPTTRGTGGNYYNDVLCQFFRKTGGIVRCKDNILRHVDNYRSIPIYSRQEKGARCVYVCVLYQSSNITYWILYTLNKAPGYWEIDGSFVLWYYNIGSRTRKDHFRCHEERVLTAITLVKESREKFVLRPLISSNSVDSTI
jgi:hypothetical protein